MKPMPQITLRESVREVAAKQKSDFILPELYKSSSQDGDFRAIIPSSVILISVLASSPRFSIQQKSNRRSSIRSPTGTGKRSRIFQSPDRKQSRTWRCRLSAVFGFISSSLIFFAITRATLLPSRMSARISTRPRYPVSLIHDSLIQFTFMEKPTATRPTLD